MKIFIDIDNTILDCDSFIYKFLSAIYSNQNINSRLKYKEIKVKSEYKESILKHVSKLHNYEFYNIDDCIEEIIKKWISDGDKVVLLSSRPANKSLISTLMICLKKYNIMYSKIILACNNKVEFCKQNGADIVIDDSFSTCYNSSLEGIMAIWYTKKFRNKDIIKFDGKNFVSATSFDFDNINDYLKKKKYMLKDTSISEGSFKLGEYKGLEIKANIVKNRSNLEGPYSMAISFIDEFNNIFELPVITFGVINNSAFLMCIQNKNKEKQDNKLAKSLDRYFRKVNKDVELDSYLANVSPNSLVAITLFNSYLRKLGIKEIIANNYMPIRYNGNKVMIFNRYKSNEEKKLIELEKHDKNQFNITNKFMYLFNRYAFHFQESISEYDDLKEEIHLYLNECSNKNDNIIFELDNSVKIFKNHKLTR